MQQASCLEGGSLLWIWPLYLHMNKKFDDDDDEYVKGFRFLHKYLFFSLPSLNVSSFIRFPLILSEMCFRKKLLLQKLGRQNHSGTTCDTALAITQPLMALNQCIEFHLIHFNTFRGMLRTNFIIAKIWKGDLYLISCDRVNVLALYTSSDDLLSMYQV